jgi:hypothetical protein
MRRHCNKIALEERKTEPHRTSARKRARKRFDDGTTDKKQGEGEEGGFFIYGK